MSHVPNAPEPEGTSELMTIADICERHHISRQALHRLRARGVFPQPAPAKGSTRPRWRQRDVDAYFAANPKRQGRRTDLEIDAD